MSDYYPNLPKYGRNSNKSCAIQLLFAFVVLLTVSTSTFAADKINTLEKSGLWGFKESGIAIRGYDTVAYFTLGKPVKGSEDFSVVWNDATWHFSTQEHAALFEGAPETYAPQFGGYCAYGVAQDYLVKIEGDQWKISDGKLYLNYDKGVQKKWLQDIPGYVTAADAKFLKLLQE